MRMIAGFLIISGLGSLSWSAAAQGDAAIAWLGISLAALWGLTLALRWPKTLHTACLSATASLGAVAVILKAPALVSVFAISASLCGWDLALMDLRLRSYPREITRKLSTRYAIRCLLLGTLGFVAALGARTIHIRLSFFSALGVLALCATLFLVLHQRVGHMMTERVSEQKEKRTAEPPA